MHIAHDGYLGVLCIDSCYPKNFYPKNVNLYNFQDDNTFLLKIRVDSDTITSEKIKDFVSKLDQKINKPLNLTFFRQTRYRGEVDYYFQDKIYNGDQDSFEKSIINSSL